MKTLVIGYGNLLRGDDGVGPFLAEKVRALNLPEVEVRALQQLQVEIAEDLRSYRRVLLIDASDGGPEVDFRRVAPSATEAATTHFLSPGLLSSLCSTLYGFEPDLTVCTIRGDIFELKDGLSSDVLRRAEFAFKRIIDFVEGGK